ncbi:MAG: AMP-binding protein [Microcoleus sp. PH2017_40_RAT_O_B]|uniref:AMP-binding protein n=1 Tax=unclassified Microcoleus TaxID=2642155 RepID=UPI001DD0D5B0|nr:MULTISPECIES: AMP-binding protein [unclassified Microcoleus]MCC3575275.1 AMP-binding protein [Microcoleus sp. PH2017_34_RAT_O_A]MCC3612852.1 AMP-binding protein [Microcoleus sp. PH2017_40_RAT_O_B]
MHSYVALNPTTFLERSGLAFPNKKAVIHSRGVMTYAELLHRSRCLAQVLNRLQVNYGDRVAVLAENSPQVIEAHFGIPAIGAILVMLNPWLTTADLLYLLGNCEAKVLILDAHFADKIPLKVRTHLTCLQQVIIFNSPTKELYPGGTLDYETCMAAEDGNWILDKTVREELDPLAINFTSGTTGRPKGVICNHRGAYLNAIGQVLVIGLSKASKYLWMMPMFHVNGWGHIWANIVVGAVQVVLSHNDRGNEAELTSMIHKYDITHLCGAPRFIRSLVELKGDRQVFKGLTITTGGAAPTTKLIECLDDMDVNFIHQYGLNETGGPYVVCEKKDEWQDLPSEIRARHLARQGVATIHAGTGLRVVNQEMKDVPCDGYTLGEVVMAGNTIAMGYYNDYEATEKAFADGWFHSGDMAVVHPDGYLEIRDRIKDLLYVETDYGWENISSIEIESVLCRHDQVCEAAVIGIPVDDKTKNSPVLVAFVEVRDKTLITEESLLKFCSYELASYKQPHVIYLADLPKTTTGKVRKDLLIADATRIAASFNGLEPHKAISTIEPLDKDNGQFNELCDK